MEGTMIAALAVAIPVVLFPAVFAWYLTAGGIVAAVREAKAVREKKAATETAH